MGKRIKVEGYIDIDEDEYDSGDLGPLTAAAHERYSSELALEDMTFSLAEED